MLQFTKGFKNKMSLGRSLSPRSKIEILKIIIEYHLTVQMLEASVFKFLRTWSFAEDLEPTIIIGRKLAQPSCYSHLPFLAPALFSPLCSLQWFTWTVSGNRSEKCLPFSSFTESVDSWISSLIQLIVWLHEQFFRYGWSLHHLWGDVS